MHPIDELGQPAAMLIILGIILSTIDRWARARLELLRLEEAHQQALTSWLGNVWLDLDTLEVR